MIIMKFFSILSDIYHLYMALKMWNKGTIRADGILVAKTGSDATKYSSSIASIYSYVKALVNAIITKG